MNKCRRDFLKKITYLTASCSIFGLQATTDRKSDLMPRQNNFDFIYSNPILREKFYNFLVNVFHLYPEKEFHNLIDNITRTEKYDEAIYLGIQAQLNEVSSFFSPLTYAIPALNKQKQIIANQTKQLLGDRTNFSGYMEVGSTGRYLDELEEVLVLDGQRIFMNEKPATYSPVDMIDRGQIPKAGIDILLNDYQPNTAQIARNSIDLVTVYIGFHHCPVNLRQEFISQIRDIMSPGGYLVLRDHNVHDNKMNHMVALAHDVFNLGTNESWQYNQTELRNFYSLAELDIMLNQMGFKSDRRKLYQHGDPTLNALMLYRKI